MDEVDRSAIEDMVKILVDADKDAIHIFPDYEPTTLDNEDIYAHISGYRVIVNYNILAKALYDAGYRKVKRREENTT